MAGKSTIHHLRFPGALGRTVPLEEPAGLPTALQNNHHLQPILGSGTKVDSPLPKAPAGITIGSCRALRSAPLMIQVQHQWY